MPLRHVAKTTEYADEPEDEERQETDQSVDEARAAGRMVGMQVGLGRVIIGNDHERVEGAGEPAKIRLQPFERLVAVLGSKPILLVGKVDQSHGHGAN